MTIRKSLAVLLAGASPSLALWSSSAQAALFTFSDEYYVNSLSEFHALFGATTTGYGTAGIYQETNTTTPVVTKLGSGTSVPGEYVQNTIPNASQELSLSGWGQSLNNGQQVASAYNLANPLNGTVLYLRYLVGGATTPFMFNSFDLRGAFPAANLSFTLQGLDAANHILDQAVLTVTGNLFETFAENWQGVSTLAIVSTASLPVNWGSGALYVDNVAINNGPVSSVPEPGAVALLGIGLAGLGFARRGKAPRA